MLGGCIFYTATIVSYGQLFRRLPETDMLRLHLTPERLIWYLIVTELLSHAFCAYRRELVQGIRNGLLEVALLRPISFWQLTLCEWSGRMLVHLSLMCIVACALGYALSGMFPLRPSDLLVLPVALVSMVCASLTSFILSGAALWVRDSAPFMWLFQKMILIAGGMLCPIVFYPHWLQVLAWCLPFPVYAAVPGNFLLDVTPGQRGLQVMDELFWTGAMLWGCEGMTRAMRRKVGQG
jgi:ABC-2 type transport system permease protein